MKSSTVFGLKCAAAFTLAVGTALGAVHLAVGRTGGPYTKEIANDWGTVTTIQNFRTSKHSYYADVTTDKFIFKSMKISSFPGRGLNVGDKIGEVMKGNDTRIEAGLVRNNVKSYNSVCFDWMPCWSKSQINKGPTP